MNLAFALLEARRTATLVALIGVLAAAWLALFDTGASGSGPGALPDLRAVESQADLSRIPAAWRAGLVILGGWCVLRSAGLAQAWFGSAASGDGVGEGSWLAPTVPSRFGIAAAAQAGIAAAGAILALILAVSIALAAGPMLASSPQVDVGSSAGSRQLLEPYAFAGPLRSQLLLPGDRYVQTFGTVRPPAESTVRVRLTPAAGAGAGTTRFEISAGDRTLVRPLVRKSWMEIELPPGALEVRARNVGDGAAALLGPRPVEIWCPSDALLRGHVRLWLHACALLLALIGATLAAGLWMSPGISAAMSLSAWLFLATTGFGYAWIPGTGDMGAALAALAGGRAPGLPSPMTWVAAAAAPLTAALLATCALRSWHHEGRG